MVVPDCEGLTTVSKTMTLRLDDEQATMLELVARADDKSMTDAVRSAIDTHIETRRKDKAFMDRIRAQRERDQQLYERLGS